MIIFMVILAILLAAGIIAALALVVGGVSFVVAFGDIIVFALIVWLIVKIIRRARK